MAGVPKKKPKKRSTLMMLLLPDSCTVVRTSRRLGFCELMLANVLALAVLGSLMMASSARLSRTAHTAVLALLGFRAFGFTVGWSSGMSGAPSHAGLLNSRSRL